jgi:hypothetical protein
MERASGISPVRTMIRGVVGAMAMTGLRRMTTGLGLVKETPPEEVADRGVPELFDRIPDDRRGEAIELAHWTFGGLAGAGYAFLPDGLRRRRWAGPVYGLAIWVGFEAVIGPSLGLRVHERGATERAMIILDHALYGAIVGAQPAGPSEASAGGGAVPPSASARHWGDRTAERATSEPWPGLCLA